MRMAVTEFKAKCTQVLREVGTTRESVEVTNRGRVIAVVTPPVDEKDDPMAFFGSLKGTASHVGDIVSPAVDEDEWEACR